jgi:hypothetical protein
LGISSQAASFSATANDIFCVVYKNLNEYGLQWKACTDAAFSAGKVKGFIANMKEVNPEIRSCHWLVYYNANDGQNTTCCSQKCVEVIKTVNFIKLQPLNSQLLQPCVMNCRLNTQLF